MRFRSRSVRAKIVALLLVPLVSLTALWAFTTISSVNEVWGLIQVNTDYRWFAEPADSLARALQDERRAAVAYTAAAKGKGDLTVLHRAESATDRQAAAFSSHATDTAKLGDLSPGQRRALEAVQSGISGLQAERGEIASGRTDWDEVFTWYTDAQAPFSDLRLQMTDIQAGDFAREAGNLVELFRAREYISREDALMYGARAAGYFTTDEFQTFLATSDGERLLFQVHETQLPANEAALYQDFTGGQVYAQLGNLETAVGTLGAERAAAGIDGAEWQSTLDTTLNQLSQIDLKAATLAGDGAQTYAEGVIRHDAVIGLIGLVGLVLTVVMSLRIGRGLVRELVGLRDSALELAGIRLPAVMRRLREGERVDLAVDVPQLDTRESGNDEIAQVGRAFNAVQRAAVEAAVDQADLRRGVAAVFVNLARRSQALLNRQLTLLDEMERRAEEPDELEDLFRLDHLTTRMRRHAEGLIILSGAAPGRTWRRPVRVLDVVRAAVGEVEDYARVRVHRMPQVAVVGAAVSDVVHLFAELVENAAVFSPPHSQVRVQGEEVANGFALEIDDRGLGMGEEAMAAANARLATGGDFDLADTDRLGLFVISRLSARHGIRVSLRRSPYGGTTAVVLLPHELLAPLPARAGGEAPASPSSEETSEQALPLARSRQRRELTAGTSEPTTARWGSGRRSSGATPLPASVHALAADRGGDADGGAEGDGQPDEGVSVLPTRRSAATRADGYLATREAREALPAPAPLLPRRVRQASLAPQLRETAPVPDEEQRVHAPEPDDSSVRERSPEVVRSTFASFQRGLSRGRETAADGAPAPTPGGRTAAGTEPPRADPAATGPVTDSATDPVRTDPPPDGPPSAEGARGARGDHLVAHAGAVPDPSAEGTPR